ncbi:ribokinase [Planktomarina temperata]|jgi:ribokinase|nr:ribokinase [Pelagibacterales bacterium]MDA7479437.1 ribokinase [Planktomarina temperata]MDA7647849.1 ribokinase [bacterium]MDC3221651.1 ribokinase [Planktomarina sp.]MDO7659859.1 ribokinase [Paracoccaceae bacterium]
MTLDIVILGVFVADTAYRAQRQPRLGETILGQSFALGPGGKGSNQSVAAGMAGASVGFITKLGKDPFADMALATWKKAGVTSLATQHADDYTGAAYIFVDENTGDNAIIVCPGAAATINRSDIDSHAEVIKHCKVLMTQLEQPIDAAEYALACARKAGATTILNPAPAVELPTSMIALCDFVTPNEIEAETITGITVNSPKDAVAAAEALLAKGAGGAIITLGENGCLYHDGSNSVHVPAINAGPVVETTGAGDAFNGGFAVAIAEGHSPLEAIRFGTATAAISVTRPGTAPSMPTRKEIESLLRN